MITVGTLVRSKSKGKTGLVISVHPSHKFAVMESATSVWTDYLDNLLIVRKGSENKNVLRFGY